MVKNKIKAVKIIFLVMASLAVWGQAARADVNDRSMWVWEQDTRDAIYDPAKAQALLDFSSAKNIKTLYLYSDSYLGVDDVTAHPDYYRSFISKAHAQGIQVDALLGSMYLKTWEYILPEKRADALAMVNNVLGYNGSSSSAQKFDGFNVDIEPYILSDWDSKQTYYAGLYLDTVAAQKQLIANSGQALDYGLCIPRWYDDVSALQNIAYNGQVKPLYQQIQDMSQYVSIMDYVNSAGAIVYDASNELGYADSINRKVDIGVETQDIQPSSSTFYGFTEQGMESVLATAGQGLNAYPSYDGFAMDHYGSYSEMTVPEPSTLMLILPGCLILLVKSSGLFRKLCFLM